MKTLLLIFTCLLSIIVKAQNGYTTYTCNAAITGAFIKPSAVLIDNAGNKWIGLNVLGSSNAGLVKYNNTNWTVYSTTSTPALPSNSITALAMDNSGNILIGTNAGLVKFTGTNFITYDISDGLPSNTVTCIETVGSSVYVGTPAGLSRFDGLNFTNYNVANGKLPNDNITSLRAETANIIWIGGVDRLVKFNINSGFTTTSYINNPISPSPGKINCIYIDAQNTKWLGTTGLGVLMYSGASFVNASDSYTLFGCVIPNNVYDITKGLNNGIALKMINNKVGSQSSGILELAPNHKVYQYYAPLNKIGDYLKINGTEIVTTGVASSTSLLLNTFNKTNYAPQLGEVNVNNFKTLDINNVNAGIANRGDMHWNIGDTYTGAPLYEVPKGSGKHSGFLTDLWIGGLDNANTLHGAAQTYRQFGVDFWPGPLDTLSAATTTANAVSYDKIWKINYTDINDFVTNFNNGNVQNNSYIPTDDILTWPAKGTGNYSRNLAPYEDVNHNGIYDPLTGGDYPKIKGDQALYFIFNDNLDAHGSSSCTPMGIEVHGMAYAYGCQDLLAETPALGYTTFYDYKIINRSSTNYHDVTIALFTDVDLGYYGDDYIGTNVTGNYGYAYNATNNDPTIGNSQGYGNYPPAQGFAVVKGPLANTSDGIDNDNDGTIDEAGEQCKLTGLNYFSNSFSGIPVTQTEPQNCIEYNNILTGKWRDGTHFTCGGNGYGGSTPTNWVYPGDPNNTGVNTDPNNNCGYWTEISANNVSNDRRMILTSGPFNLGAGQMQEIEYAFVTSFDSTSATHANLLSAAKLATDIQLVNSFYIESNHSNCDLVSTGIKNNDKSDQFIIYPNPAKALINVKLGFSETTKTDYELTDVMGKIIFQNTTTGNNFTINIGDVTPGIYFLRLKANNIVSVKKIVKE